MKQYAIFDMDGLMFDTERVYMETWHEMAKERGFVLSDSFDTEASGTIGKEAHAVISKYFTECNPETIFEECKKRAWVKFAQGIRVKPGLEDLLSWLKGQGVRCAVASNSDKKIILENLKRAGVEEFFEAAVSGMDLPNGKPSPDIFLLTAECLGTTADTCMVFEDSRIGIRAAVAAGSEAYMIPDVLPPDNFCKEHCAGIYDSLSQLLDIWKEEGRTI